MIDEATTYVTSAGIAEAIGRDVQQVRHILSSRPISPLGRAGLVRLYHPSVIEQVRAEAQAIEAKRKAAPA